MSLDKLTTDTVATATGTGLAGILLGWIGLKWRFNGIRDDIKEIKHKLETLRSLDTCGLLINNIDHQFASLENNQREMKDDIKQLLVTMFKIQTKEE